MREMDTRGDVPLLELVLLTCDTRFLLCIVAFICYEKTKKDGREGSTILYLVLIVSPLNKAQSY
jgi:hypothetical protein